MTNFGDHERTAFELAVQAVAVFVRCRVQDSLSCSARDLKVTRARGMCVALERNGFTAGVNSPSWIPGKSL